MCVLFGAWFVFAVAFAPRSLFPSHVESYSGGASSGGTSKKLNCGNANPDDVMKCRKALSDSGGVPGKGDVMEAKNLWCQAYYRQGCDTGSAAAGACSSLGTYWTSQFRGDLDMNAYCSKQPKVDPNKSKDCHGWYAAGCTVVNDQQNSSSPVLSPPVDNVPVSDVM